jgi:CRP-like cAMP-binding protein
MFRTASTPDKFNDVDLFADCSRSERRRLAALMTPVHIHPGTPIMREGGSANEFVLITGGTARVTRQVDRATVPVAELGVGAFVGEMGLLSGRPRSATVTSVSEVTALVSSGPEFWALVDASPSVARRIASAARERAVVNEGQLLRAG